MHVKLLLFVVGPPGLPPKAEWGLGVPRHFSDAFGKLAPRLRKTITFIGKAPNIIIVMCKSDVLPKQNPYFRKACLEVFGPRLLPSSCTQPGVGLPEFLEFGQSPDGGGQLARLLAAKSTLSSR